MKMDWFPVISRQTTHGESNGIFTYFSFTLNNQKHKKHTTI